MEITEITSGLRFPEGPVWMPDGSVLCVELLGGTVVRVQSDGKKAVGSENGGSPNGLAIGPNGVGLSPDGRRVYAAETYTGRVFAWDLAGPGELAAPPPPVGNGGELICGLPGMQLFDSLAVDGDGNVVVGTLVNGGLTVISPDGSSVEHVPFPDPMVTNVCFGGDDPPLAYVTWSAPRQPGSTPWPPARLELAVQAGRP